MPVCSSFRVTLAFGTTAPVGSCTVPEIAPTMRSCAHTLGTSPSSRSHSPKVRSKAFVWIIAKNARGCFACGFITKPPSKVGIETPVREKMSKGKDASQPRQGFDPSKAVWVTSCYMFRSFMYSFVWEMSNRANQTRKPVVWSCIRLGNIEPT